MTGGSIHENGGLPKNTPQTPTFKSSDFLDFSQSLIFNQFKVLIFWIFYKYDFPISIFSQFLKVQSIFIFLSLDYAILQAKSREKQQIKWFDIHFLELWNYLEHLFFCMVTSCLRRTYRICFSKLQGDIKLRRTSNQTSEKNWFDKFYFALNRNDNISGKLLNCRVENFRKSYL